MVGNATLIENSSNKNRTEWLIINKLKNGTKKKPIILLSGDTLNNYFINSVEIKCKLVKPKLLM